MISKWIKKDNTGATMVMALVAIAFVAILATMILAASFANINMKRMENRSKDTFYTAESVLDEVRAGLGKDGLSKLGLSYTKVLTTLVYKDDQGYQIVATNEKANSDMKKYYIESMYQALTGNMEDLPDNILKEDDSSVYLANAVNYLNAFIKGYNETNQTARVKSISKIITNKESIAAREYTITLKDVAIEYKQDRADENYFSNITVDLILEYPEISVDFTGSNRLNEFASYAIITDRTLAVDDTKLEVSGAHVYAGSNIRVAVGEQTGSRDSNFTVNGQVLTQTGMLTNANIVTRGDIVVRGSRLGISSFQANNCDIWCDNLVVDQNKDTSGNDLTLGGNITTNYTCKTYVRDDLNLFGYNSQVRLGGSYYGYKYDGADNDSNKRSSAIIITGTGSMLNMSLENLTIAGRSYVIIDDVSNNEYMMGESLSVKADQDLYLVPADEIRGGKSNPMTESSWEILQEDAGTDPIVLTDTRSALFADGSGSLLNEAKPYVEKKKDNTVYLYYNFRTKDCATEYVRRVLRGVDSERKSQMVAYFTNVLSGVTGSGITINVADTGNIYTAGALVQKLGSNLQEVDNTGVYGSSDFTLQSQNYENRYKILRSLLIDVDESRIVLDAEDAVKEMYPSFEAGSNTFNDTVDLTTTIVDYSLGANGYNNSSYLVKMEGYNFIKTFQTSNYTVPSYVHGGVIICNGQVNLNHDFKGLIICKGNLNITNDARVTGDMNLVEYLIKNEDAFIDETRTDVEPDDVSIPFRQFFYAYRDINDDPDSQPLVIETIDYTDVVGYANWRKYSE